MESIYLPKPYGTKVALLQFGDQKLPRLCSLGEITYKGHLSQSLQGKSKDTAIETSEEKKIR